MNEEHGVEIIVGEARHKIIRIDDNGACSPVWIESKIEFEQLLMKLIRSGNELGWLNKTLITLR